MSAICLTVQYWLQDCNLCGVGVAGRLEGITEQLQQLTAILLGSQTQQSQQSHQAADSFPAYRSQFASHTAQQFREQSGLKQWQPQGELMSLLDYWKTQYGVAWVSHPGCYLGGAETGFMLLAPPCCTDLCTAGEVGSRWGTTSILIERDAQQEITNILRLDNKVP